MSDFSYYTEPITTKQRYLLDVKNNIITERVWLFNDFCRTLSYAVVKYFVGVEELSELEEQENHFYYCLDATIDVYAAEGYGFSLTPDFRLYLFSHFNKTFYSAIEDDDGLEYHRQMAYSGFKQTFDLVKPKTMSAYDQFLSLYKNFNSNFSALTIDSLK